MANHSIDICILEVCVKIMTGSGSHDGGFLKVMVNGEIKANRSFAKGSTVFDSCMSELRAISVQNPKNDAWVGTIVITKDGQAASTKCQKCGGEKNFERISVDGNSDSRSQAYCLNKKTCEIDWVFQNGIIEIHLFIECR